MKQGKHELYHGDCPDYMRTIEDGSDESKPTRWTGSKPCKYPSRGLVPGRTSPRDCAHCGMSCGPSGDDPCIENLPGAMNACCGHGDPEAAYIQFSPDEWIGGLVAFERMQYMKADDPSTTTPRGPSK